MSLDNLPDIEFCETDTDTVEKNVITTYEGIAGTTLYDGDPIRLFLESLASVIVQQRQIIDYTGKQNLLKFSEETILDHLGSFTETSRLEVAKSTVTMRFSIDSALGFVVAVPAGTRVSPDGKLFFETTAYAEITAGNTYVDVTAQCQTAGAIGNGFVAGQIKKMVDPLDYITSVFNTDTSENGADAEKDDPYRERIHTAPESFSVAGPTGAYQHWSKSVHQDIIDIAVYRTSPLDDLTETQLEGVLDIAGIGYSGLGRDEKQVLVAGWLCNAVVNVCPLLNGGAVPDQTMLDLVSDKLNDREIRPLTDKVEVAAPTQVGFNIEFIYYISSENRLIVSDIQAAVTAAVDDYVTWQKEKLGRDINPDRLVYNVINAGAHRVEVTSPVFASVNINQVASDGTISITYGGLEDD